MRYLARAAGLGAKARFLLCWRFCAGKITKQEKKMVNESKVKLMTELASYLEGKGRSDLKVMRRFKLDYVSLNSFRVMLLATLGLLIIFGLDVLNKFLSNIENISEFDFIGQGTVYLTLWVLAMLFYAIIGGRIYRRHYAEAKQRADRYESLLNRLDEENLK